MTLHSGLATEIQKLAPSAIVELFELDATSLGGDVLRFHAGTNGLSANIVWQGDTYVRFPIQAEGFEFSGQGVFPRPKLRVSNALSAITTVLLAYGDLLGSKVTRKRTMVKFLDAANFAGGVNATEDDTAEFQDDVYFIDRKALEDRDVVEFELASSLDLVGVALPRRQVIQNVCPWAYRGSECGYTGVPVFDANDEVIASASSAEAQAVIDAYAAMKSAEEDLADAEETLSAAAVAMGPACEYVKAETRYTFVSVSSGTNCVIHRAQTGVSVAWWGGSIVTLGITYRLGVLQSTITVAGQGQYKIYKIERWAIDTAACTDATTNYDAALADRDAKTTALATAQTALETAHAALPDDDAIYSVERCGKRLSSCKIRFGENEELPFGSFPAAGLVR